MNKNDLVGEGFNKIDVERLVHKLRKGILSETKNVVEDKITVKNLEYWYNESKTEREGTIRCVKDINDFKKYPLDDKEREMLRTRGIDDFERYEIIPIKTIGYMKKDKFISIDEMLGSVKELNLNLAN